MVPPLQNKNVPLPNKRSAKEGGESEGGEPSANPQRICEHIRQSLASPEGGALHFNGARR